MAKVVFVYCIAFLLLHKYVLKSKGYKHKTVHFVREKLIKAENSSFSHRV